MGFEMGIMDWVVLGTIVAIAVTIFVLLCKSNLMRK